MPTPASRTPGLRAAGGVAAAAALGLLGASLLTGCSGGDDADLGPTGAGASASTGDTATSTVVDRTQFVADLAETLAGIRTVHVDGTLTEPGSTTTSTGDLDYTQDPPSLRTDSRTRTAGSTRTTATTVIAVGGTTWFRGPAVPDGKFLRLDSTGSGSTSGSGSGAPLLPGLDTGDPKATLERLNASVEAVTAYAPGADGTRRFTLALTRGATSVSAYDVWLDDAGRLVRVRLGAGSGSDRTTVDLRLSDQDAAVRISPPSASQVVRLAPGERPPG